ncbi:MAG TPA: DUF4924 family protein [Flavobacteriales bacterium]|nr:DUF4924 family protein [Flavobacteriales bacterium]
MESLQERKIENVAGYIISMWHIEDLMRAADMDLEKVEERLIAPMEAGEEDRAKMRAWYSEVIQRMRDEGITRVGHLAEVEEAINELEFLHRSFIDVLDDPEYDALFAKAEPGIRTLQQHAGGDPAGVVETCFTAVYGVMVLRAQDKVVSKETLEAEGHIRKLLERLSVHYKQMRRLPGVSMN